MKAILLTIAATTMLVGCADNNVMMSDEERQAEADIVFAEEADAELLEDTEQMMAMINGAFEDGRKLNAEEKSLYDDYTNKYDYDGMNYYEGQLLSFTQSLKTSLWLYVDDAPTLESEDAHNVTYWRYLDQLRETIDVVSPE